MIKLRPELVFPLLATVLGKIAQKLPSACNRLDVVLEDLVGDARDFTVHLGAA